MNLIVDEFVSAFGTCLIDWPVDRLRDHLGQIVGGDWGDDPAAHDEGLEIPVIRVADIDGVDINVESLTIRRLKDSKLPGRLIRENSLVIEKSGGGEKQLVGRAVLGRNIRFDAICSNFMAKVDCGPTLDGLYTSYLLQAAYSAKLNEPHIQQTTGIQNLRVTDYLNLKVGIPTVLEQRRIAAYLDASCAAIDAAVAAKRRQIGTLDALRESRIERAITHGLQESSMQPVGLDWIESLPIHWKAVRVKRVLAAMDYGISVSTNDEGRFPVLKMGHIQNGEIEYAKLDYVDDVPETLLLEENDVLYNRTNSPDQVGKAAIFRKTKDKAITFASYLVRLRLNHRVLPEFFNYVANSVAFLGFARRMAIPSVQQSNLNSTRYGRLWIPLPPLEEQHCIVNSLNAMSLEVHATQSVLRKQIDTLTAYRKSLIHECVTGQRRIGEAELAAAGLAP